MTTLGLAETGMPRAQVALNFRTGWLSHFKVALSSAGGAAIILAAFELLQRQPQAGFALLAQWGPWPFIALIGLAFLGRFLSRMNDTVQAAFTSMVDSGQQQASASGRQADALTKLAEQGGEQARETHRLAMFAAQESQNVYERLDRQDEVLNSVAHSVNAVLKHVRGEVAGGTNANGS